MSKPVSHSGQRSSEAFHRTHRSFFVGLFVLIPAVLMPAFLVYTFGKADFFQDWRHLHAIYEKSHGIAAGDAVTVSDIRVGHVTGVDLTRDGCAYVSFKVDLRHAHLVRKDSRALLRQKNILVGDLLIALSKGSNESALVEEGDTLTAEPPMNLDRVLDQVRSMVGTFESILNDVNEGKGFIGHLVKEDMLVAMVIDVVAGLKRVVSNTDKAMRQANWAFTEFGRLGEPLAGAADSLIAVLEEAKPAVIEARELVAGLNEASSYVSPVLKQAQADLEEIETLLKGLRKHWLFRRGVEDYEEENSEAKKKR
jgi:phospholipid/cholesterol/gamma-HCH transport system substrate-binding protein